MCERETVFNANGAIDCIPLEEAPQICITCLIFGALIQWRQINLCSFNAYGFSVVISYAQPAF